MLGTKISFSEACHPQTDVLSERLILKMEGIIRRFFSYGMEYEDHQGYINYCVTLLPAIKLAYNTSQHSTSGTSPSLVEKRWNALFPIQSLVEKPFNYQSHSQILPLYVETSI
ncbi:hypothetical protein O181_003969 [Austropuccinia psidii MF-1]|uniref:Integrase catalytic domain-containing protein n=1 Tax=Austropuccinia psidii MF-1 TaxID=1389203 RepID=A0A9Q3BFC0_9BASI|nr:hypothetical protein [Austropuccinia psidii MF-1]